MKNHYIVINKKDYTRTYYQLFYMMNNKNIIVIFFNDM